MHATSVGDSPVDQCGFRGRRTVKSRWTDGNWKVLPPTELLCSLKNGRGAKINTTYVNPTRVSSLSFRILYFALSSVFYSSSSAPLPGGNPSDPLQNGLNLAYPNTIGTNNDTGTVERTGAPPPTTAASSFSTAPEDQGGRGGAQIAFPCSSSKSTSGGGGGRKSVSDDQMQIILLLLSPMPFKGELVYLCHSYIIIIRGSGRGGGDQRDPEE